MHIKLYTVISIFLINGKNAIIFFHTSLNFSLFDSMKNKFEIYFSLSIFVKRFIEKIAIIALLFSLRYITWACEDKNILSFLRIWVVLLFFLKRIVIQKDNVLLL